MKLYIDNHECFVDDDDAPLICATLTPWYVHKSNGVPYVVRWLIPGVKLQQLHRFILGCSDEFEVDHINRNGLDNRRRNLRLCTRFENAQNRGPASHNRSGFKGVYFDSKSPRYAKWRAEISANGDRFRLGYHETPEKAAAAYDRAARVLHGTFAVTNASLGLI